MPVPPECGDTRPDYAAARKSSTIRACKAALHGAGVAWKAAAGLRFGMDADLRLLEELTLSTWPALANLYRDGWVIRLSGGHTGRANSVTVLAPGREPVEAKVGHAEAIYARAGLVPLFRMTPLAEPGLAPLLDAHGYDVHKTSHVMVTDSLPDRADGSVRLCNRQDSAWNRGYAEMSGLSQNAARLQERIQSAIALPCLYAKAIVEDRVAAVALAVIDRGWAGIFEVATHPDFRGRGLAGRVVQAALAGARRRGAEKGFLQVQADNARAIPIYERLGFRRLYDYHYRKPTA